ncbi:hypothetical protein H8356DRAFT_1356373 [Neocallimastix lanati (nom. inval.)]|nr:hypothetical protein H8356DRAFT_1356373 [Neocallimastix sp. JGI-2020a]
MKFLNYIVPFVFYVMQVPIIWKIYQVKINTKNFIESVYSNFTQLYAVLFCVEWFSVVLNMVNDNLMLFSNAIYKLYFQDFFGTIKIYHYEHNDLINPFLIRFDTATKYETLNKLKEKAPDNFKNIPAYKRKHYQNINNLKETEGNTKRERHTNLTKLTNMKPHKIIKDLANTKCNIIFGQILDLCPKLNSLEAMEPFIIKEEENNRNNIKNANFIVMTWELLHIDSGNNLNLVSITFINSLPVTYEQVNICRGQIYEAFGDSTIANASIDIYFDFLLGLKPIADNYHFIHPILRSLCRFTSVEKFDIIAPIAKNQAVEKNLCFINFIRPNKSSEENSIIELSNNKEYKEDSKIMENSKNSTYPGDIKDNKIYYNQNIYRNKLTNLNDNILEYNNNMKNNINCNRHKQEINQNN